MSIVYVPIDELKPNPKNPNKHSEDQIKRLSQLIAYQGWRLPIIVSKQSGFIVSGHGRLEAAKLLKLTEVPVTYQDFTSSEQEYAFLVSDNAISSWAGLDLSLINLELPSLGPDFDLDLLGVKDFTLDLSDANYVKEESSDEPVKKFIIEVHFPNDMEMNDVKDDLLNRGYIVKVK